MRIAFRLAAVASVFFAGIADTAEPILGSINFSPSLEHPFGWRGDGTGRFVGATPPTVWSETKNVRWSARVGSGYSSPILTEKLVFVTSEPNLLIGLDRGSGKVIWKIEIKPDKLPTTRTVEPLPTTNRPKTAPA